MGSMTTFVEESTGNRPARSLGIVLGVLQVLIGLGAVGGGIGLVSDPSGANLGFSVEWLSVSPFADYLVPGLILLVVNGLGNLAGGVLSFAGKRFAGETAALLGLFMVAWITLQMFWVPYSWLQPLYLALGLLELVLGLQLRRNLVSARLHEEV
jgi:hypothetical protein